MRSYLDANCAQCHRPGGVQANWDARFDTALANQNILNGPVFNSMGVTNAKEVAPGSLSRSIMFLRANTNSAMKMPPLARNVIDTNFIPVLAQWITNFVPGPLPVPWQHQDIGAVGVSGDASSLLNAFTVSGSGVDIWGTADSFHYAYVNVAGDCEVIARVASLTDTDPWAKASVMIRESVAPGAPNACLALTSENGVEYQWRPTNSGASFYVQGPNVGAPYYVRLTRTNNSFTAWSSGDGSNWSQLGNAVSIGMSGNVLAGLAVSAVNNGALNTATFDAVRVNNAALLDSDGDGMPDSYEMANGFNKNDPSDAFQDADGDGMTNLQEYMAGTNPRDAASVLRITRITRANGDLIFSFVAATGRTYVVERATNMPVIAWQALMNVGPFSNGAGTVTNFGGLQGTNGFYRLRLVP